MKTFSKLSFPNGLFVVAFALVLMAPISSFATNKAQVSRNLVITTYTAECCVNLGPTVQINFPTTVAPAVIVTWSTDYIVFDTVLFGLSVNGGTCTLYGPGEANIFASGTGSSFVSGTFQSVVLPADGLKKGINTFAVCGGGAFKAVTFSTGSNTLTVQASN